MSLHTRICELFEIEFPIVQTGMGWVSGPALTAATSEAGGLGILAAATLTYDELEAAIAAVKGATSKPFGVNLRADQADIDSRVALMIEQGVTVASFAGAPPKDTVTALKAAGVKTMPTVGKVRHAQKVAALGVDVIIAQGHEGGGHTGPVPTTLLLPAVVKAVDIPVLGAGGFSTGEGLVAALAYGAAGIAMGTRFLLTEESPVPEAVKRQYLNTSVTGTVVTSRIDGAPQRVISTPMIDRLERSSGLRAMLMAVLNAIALSRHTQTSLRDLMQEGLRMRKRRDLTWGQLAMAANAPMLTRASMVEGNAAVGILPTGQVVGSIETLPSAGDVVATIMREAEATLARLTLTPAEALPVSGPAPSEDGPALEAHGR